MVASLVPAIPLAMLDAHQGVQNRMMFGAAKVPFNSSISSLRAANEVGE
jgi:hypothetical protein